MAKKGENRERIDLKCTECKKNTTTRLELKKFCPVCGKQTLHKEAK